MSASSSPIRSTTPLAIPQTSTSVSERARDIGEIPGKRWSVTDVDIADDSKLSSGGGGGGGGGGCGDETKLCATPANDPSLVLAPSSPLASPSRHPRSSPKAIRRHGSASSGEKGVPGKASEKGKNGSTHIATRALPPADPCTQTFVRTVPSTSSSPRFGGVSAASHHVSVPLPTTVPPLHSLQAPIAGRTAVTSNVSSAIPTALTPSKAECQRAVFAAFLWHEGLVHDAMACATFLKFQPNLSKPTDKRKPEDESKIGKGIVFTVIERLGWFGLVGFSLRLVIIGLNCLICITSSAGLHVTDSVVYTALFIPSFYSIFG